MLTFKNFSNIKLFNSVYFYLTIWLIINLLQSYFTMLGDDEAYYWDCSRQLVWGYFHQPPMTMWLVKVGYYLFNNEFGVRLAGITLSFGTQILLFKIVNPSSVKKYFLLIFSCLLANFGGFYIAPETVLIFFLALYIYLFKIYLEKDSFLIAFTLGIVCAAIALSKYTGVVLIIGAIIPNLKLLKRISFWIIPVFTLTLLAPHFIWLFENDFITLKFHYLERSPEGFLWYYPFHMLAGLLLVHGPFLSLFLFIGMLIIKPTNPFEKTIKWIGYVSLAFFVWMSLKTRIEANWTSFLIFPLMYFGYRYIFHHFKYQKLINVLLAVSLVGISLFRLSIVFDFLPEQIKVRKEFFGWDTYAKEVEAITQGRPIIFPNNYQKTAKYNFYSKNKLGYSLNLNNSGGNQFVLNYAGEEFLQGKDVMLVSPYYGKVVNDTLNNGSVLSYAILKNFESYNRLVIRSKNIPKELKINTSYSFTYELYNPTEKTVFFKKNKQLLPYFMIEDFVKHNVYSSQRQIGDLPFDKIEPKEKLQFTIEYTSPPYPGKHRLRTGIVPAHHHYPERNNIIHLVNIVKE